MPKVEKYKSKIDQTLDCGHSVKAGEDIFITKTFTCEEDAGKSPYGPARIVTRSKRNDNAGAKKREGAADAQEDGDTQ